MATWLSPYRLLEIPWVFRLSQRFGRATLEAYEHFVTKYVKLAPEERILEIGCGLGAHAHYFDADYTGIDINAEYIVTARQTRPGRRFEAMDATQLGFPDATFDHAVSIATYHHLSDEQVLASVRETLRVLKPGASFHVIDPVLPVDGSRGWKYWLFMLDRGRHARVLSRHRDLLAEAGEITAADIRVSSRHDVSYTRLTRKN